MQIDPNTPRAARTISGLELTVPQPYAAGQPLSEATASILNQTFAENISNNMRARLALGFSTGPDAPAIPHTAETAQPLIDAYVAEYEPGVRRGGGGERTVADPVEREARKIARSKAIEYVKSMGGKPADFDMAPIVDAIFEKNRDILMAEGKKIVAALAKAKEKGDGLDLTGLNFGLPEA
jgi:hypothetical protein